MFFRCCETCANVAVAVEETITTPTPGLGHGRIGDIAACFTLVASFLGMF